MSGGRFGYLQTRFPEIVEAIEEEIKGDNDFKEETIAEFKKGIKLIKTAQIYAQRIDWLVSGDDSEDSFHERLKEDLNECGYDYK